MMKKILILIIGLWGIAANAQVKISAMPTYTGNPNGSFVPIIIGGVNRKIDPSYFGFNKLDSMKVISGELYYYYAGGASVDVGPFGITNGKFQRQTNIATMGNSLAATGTWQSELVKNLGIYWAFVNHGNPGDRTDQMLTRFYLDVILPGDIKYVTIEGGINDIMGDRSAASIEANLQSMYTLAHNAGIKVVAACLTPWGGYSLFTPTREIVRNTVNAWIMGTATNVDFRVNANPTLWNPADTTALLPAYSKDLLHMSDSGYHVFGRYVYTHVTWTQDNSNKTINITNNAKLDQDVTKDANAMFHSLNLSNNNNFFPVSPLTDGLNFLKDSTPTWSLRPMSYINGVWVNQFQLWNWKTNSAAVAIDTNGLATFQANVKITGLNRIQLDNTTLAWGLGSKDDYFIGPGGNVNMTGINNTSIGVGALASNLTGAGNHAGGSYALTSNTSGSNNTGSGVGALALNTTGHENTAEGNAALTYNTTGYGNTASGAPSLLNNTTGIFNTADGVNSLNANQTGSHNFGGGDNSLYYNIDGSYNTGVGSGALYFNKHGNYNIGLGYYSGRNDTSTSNTLFISDSTPNMYYKLALNAGAASYMIGRDGAGNWGSYAVPAGGGLTGGTTNQLTKWTSSTSVGNSIITDDGTHVGINNNSPSFTFEVGNSSVPHSTILRLNAGSLYGGAFYVDGEAFWGMRGAIQGGSANDVITQTQNKNYSINLNAGTGADALLFNTSNNTSIWGAKTSYKYNPTMALADSLVLINKKYGDSINALKSNNLNTVTVNGSTQTLGSNPSFTVTGSAQTLDQIVQNGSYVFGGRQANFLANATSTKAYINNGAVAVQDSITGRLAALNYTGTSGSMVLANSLTGVWFVLTSPYTTSTQQNFYLPKIGGTIPTAVNGVAADSTGNILLPFTKVGPGLATTVAGDSLFLKPKVFQIASAATHTINMDTTSLYVVTAQAAATTFANPTGATPNEGTYIRIRIKDNGTAQTIAFGTIWRGSTDIPLVTTTTAGKTMYLQFSYNAIDAKFDLIRKVNGF
jgi:hypothetical protein